MGNRRQKLLGVYLDTFFSFNAHCVQVVNKVIKINNALKALAGTNLGQQKETLLLTYKVASQHEESITPSSTHLICQHSNRKHDGQQIIKLSTTTYLEKPIDHHLSRETYRGNLSDETTTGHSVTAPLRPLQALELLQKETEAD